MRLLNKAQLQRLPMVDQGNLYFGDTTAEIVARRTQLAQQKARAQANARAAQARANQAAKMDEARRIRSAQMHGEMLQRSLRNTGHNVVAAAKKQGMGWVPQYGVKNPTLGFVDEVTNLSTNFNQEDAIPAQEFGNHLTCRNFKGYTKFQDFPLVIDAPRGDFGGILTDDPGSADFSEYIVNDAPSDFGYTPRARRR